MKPTPNLSRSALVVILGASFLSSCAKPGIEIRTSPVIDSISVRSTYDPEKLSAYTASTLKNEGLYSNYRRDPEGTRKTLAQSYVADPSPALRLALGELCLDAAGRLEKSRPVQAVGLYLDAAKLSHDGALASSAQKQDPVESPDRILYACSVGKMVRLLHSQKAELPLPLSVSGDLGVYKLGQASGRNLARIQDFDAMIPAGLIKFKGIDWKHIKQTGFGVAMVAHEEASEIRKKEDPMIPPAGFGTTLNASLRFSGSKATIVLQNLMKDSRAVVEGTNVELAGDYTAPLAYLYRTQPKEGRLNKMMALLRPYDYENDIRFFSLEPFDKNKIPLILVHGLMSSATAWLEFVDLVRNDPVIRENYQILVFNYPSGAPIGKNAAELREGLQKMRAFYDPRGTNAKMRKMVIIGHSMGGILSNMQIRDSGDHLVNAYVKGPLDSIEMDPEVKANLKRVALFEANPDITRAVLMAAPHRGSSIASSALGRFGASLITAPLTAVDTLFKSGSITESLTEGARQALQRGRNSVTALRPDNPLLPAVLELPVSKKVTIHSIMGQTNTKADTLDGTDGLVLYTSADLKEAESVKVVLGASHTSVVEDEEAIKEVWRILYLHLGKKPPVFDEAQP